ncbi:hypothetical protein C2845_PM13G03970 [Panicum miliaceum]|uniref:Uncharacterized protein n=1 Tax=Panicum miliaceum TaxID=4540 RepID=A0A3L6RHU4_PANMI|nr:hypothetical protein C2845_PM13G03970 [Panicum miliaceum]
MTFRLTSNKLTVKAYSRQQAAWTPQEIDLLAFAHRRNCSSKITILIEALVFFCSPDEASPAYNGFSLVEKKSSHSYLLVLT